MKAEIRKNKYGINAGCLICGRRQDGDRLTRSEVAGLMRSMDGKNHKVFWEEPEGEE